MKSCGNKFAFSSKKLIGINDEQGFSDFVSTGELLLDAKGNVCYRLISSNVVENLRDFTFFKTKGGGALLTTVYIDNQDNKVKFGRLDGSDFSSQSAELVGIDLYKAKSKMPERTRLKDYNMVYVGDCYILLQYKNQDEADKSPEYLLTLNELGLPIVTS
jgi:hypothetical protein